MGCVNSKEETHPSSAEKIIVERPLAESPAPNPFQCPHIRMSSDDFGLRTDSAGVSTTNDTSRTKPSPATTACSSPVHSAKRQEQGSAAVNNDDEDQVLHGRRENECSTNKMIEQHVNSLDRYQSAAKPPIQQAAAAPPAAPVTTTTSTHAKAESRPPGWSRRSRSHRSTPFEAPNQFLLLADDGPTCQRAEELWQRQLHESLSSLEWSCAVPTTVS